MKVVVSSLFVLTAVFSVVPLSVVAFTVPTTSAMTRKTSSSSLPMSAPLPVQEEEEQGIDNKSGWDVSEYLTNKLNLAQLQDTVRAGLANTMAGGQVGQRGEVYTATQFAVLAAIALGGVPVIGNVLNVLLGPGLFLVGTATLVLSATDLGANLSPWPIKATSSSSQLVTDGLYAEVRHPMYAGLLAACAGLAVLTDSADRLLLTAVLLYVLNVKTDVEEDDLVRQFPNEYPVYQAEVTNKFFPQSLLNVLPWNAKK